MKAVRAAFLFVCTICLIVLVAGLARPTSDNMASTLEVLARPDAMLQLEAQRQESALALARVEAEAADARAAENTMRLALVLGALVLVVGMGALIAVLRTARQPAQPVRVLLPTDPEFFMALHEMGGYRINGVPLIEGKVVEAIDVWAE